MDGAMKIGQIARALQDLSVPLGGLLLTVTRTDDSGEGVTESAGQEGDRTRVT